MRLVWTRHKDATGAELIFPAAALEYQLAALTVGNLDALLMDMLFTRRGAAAFREPGKTEHGNARQAFGC